MATIKDVAKLAGVAVSTASYALNNSSKISPGTKRKVIDAAVQLNYQKNGLARDLKLNKTQTIGLILSDLSGPFYSELIKGVQEVTLSNEYDLIACSSLGGYSSTAVKFLKEKRVDGVIVLAANIDDLIIMESVREDFPIVVLDRELTANSIINVSVDNIHGGYLAAKHLLDAGHQDILFVGGPPNSRDNQLRYQGFLNALTEREIHYTPKWNLEGKFTREGGYYTAKMIMMQGKLPSAIFCANDEMAIGAVQAFQESGLQVPFDISVVGFDDIEIVQYMNPPLTTVKQPKYEMGSLAAHLIFQALNGDIPTREYVLPTELIVRNSTISK
jgi:LacI family transcriptional regulator